MKKLLSCLSLLICWTGLRAESSKLDFFHSTGKIYVVVACIAVIFIGIVLFLVRLDRKLSNLEQHIKDEQ